MRLTLTQVVGQPTKTVWSMMFLWGVAAAKEVEIEENQSMLMLAVTVRGEEAGERGAELMDKLEQVGGRLNEERGVREIYKELQGLEQQGLEMVGMLMRQERVVMLGLGEGRIVLRRGGKTGQVFRGQKGRWLIMEGRIEAGDRWLVGTEGLVGEMSKDLIEDMLNGEEMEEAGEDLVTLVQAAEESAEAAGVLVGLEGGKEKGEPRADRRAEPGVKIKTPKVYLKSVTKRQKTAVSVGLVLLMLLGVSLVFGWQKRQQMERESRLNEVLGHVNQREESARKLQADNPIQAKQWVVEAQEMINQAMGEFAEREEMKKQLEEKAKTLADLYVLVSGETQVAGELWYELGLIREGMYGSSIDYSGDKVYVLDKNLGVLGEINQGTKEGGLAAGGDLMKGAREFEIAGVRGVVLAETGVIEVNVENKTSDRLVEGEEEWGEIRGVSLFSGNVYLLDAGKSEIWQYPAIERGVGERRRWLAAGLVPDLTRAVDMVIDGDVWVMAGDGEIWKFRRGNEENFGVQGLAEPFGEVAAIETREEIEEVFILDRGGRRIVVVSKEGEYLRQYNWDGLAAADDLTVDPEGEIYILVGHSIYTINL